MNVLTRSQFLFFALMVAFFYVILNALLDPTIFIVLLNSLFFGVSVSVIYVLWPLAWRAIKTHQFDRVSQLSVGIIVSWLSVVSVRIASAISHNIGKLGYFATSPIISLSTYMSILGGILYITAPGMADARLKYNRGALAASVIIGICLAVTAYYFQNPK
jgi:hypothetical protein